MYLVCTIKQIIVIIVAHTMTCLDHRTINRFRPEIFKTPGISKLKPHNGSSCRGFLPNNPHYLNRAGEGK